MHPAAYLGSRDIRDISILPVHTIAVIGRPTQQLLRRSTLQPSSTSFVLRHDMQLSAAGPCRRLTSCKAGRNHDHVPGPGGGIGGGGGYMPSIDVVADVPVVPTERFVTSTGEVESVQDEQAQVRLQ